MTLEPVKCPFCKFEFRTDVKKKEKDGETGLVRGNGNFWKRKPEKSMFIDLKCLNCGKIFEYEVKSRPKKKME